MTKKQHYDVRDVTERKMGNYGRELKTDRQSGERNEPSVIIHTYLNLCFTTSPMNNEAVSSGRQMMTCVVI